jgi:hypothetical protein
MDASPLRSELDEISMIAILEVLSRAIRQEKEINGV